MTTQPTISFETKNNQVRIGGSYLSIYQIQPIPIQAATWTHFSHRLLPSPAPDNAAPKIETDSHEESTLNELLLSTPRKHTPLHSTPRVCKLPHSPSFNTLHLRPMSYASPRHISNAYLYSTPRVAMRPRHLRQPQRPTTPPKYTKPHFLPNLHANPYLPLLSPSRLLPYRTCYPCLPSLVCPVIPQ
ncbi:hypothetical protein Pcinc_020542 [Petrolisthes cinctipes]|uniref:Uncharacterized protein n=1 Tax=Petrolisthes cinctipes TaxID=88211 RepID=A0AAE1KJU0_PETCI|nr:hypothetical protein Pcinc_020542 [Petrolisthes cinctipes]